MHVLKIIFITLEVLLLFNLLIFVHELGHFLAARWRGLRVERFSIWFGKPVWKKTYNGVEYCLGCIPAGGYVALPQMATMETIEGKTKDSEAPLPPISALDKIIVAVAGPLFSFLLAVAFAVVVWGVGKPVNQDDKTTVIGWVDRNGPAWKAGLRPGDEIKEVDSHPVTQFSATTQDSITWRIVSSEGTNIPIKFVRDGQEQMAYPAVFKRQTKWYERKALRQILVSPAHKAVIADVITNSPAARAGLTNGDEVIAVNGEKIHSFVAVIAAEDAMTNSSAPPVKLTIRRAGKEFERELKAEKPVKPADIDPLFGIRAWEGSTNLVLTHPGVGEQIRASVGQITGTLRTLLSRKSDVGAQQLGGAVMIIRVYSNLFDSEEGWRLVIWFSVVINVNLALLNLLPLPVLDGGHITLALIEIIRRRAASGKILEDIQTTFAAALIAFMIYIAFFDIGDWVRSARREKNQPIVFAPKN